MDMAFNNIRLCSSCDHEPHQSRKCPGCSCLADREVRPRTGINDGPAGSIIPKKEKLYMGEGMIESKLTPGESAWLRSFRTERPISRCYDAGFEAGVKSARELMACGHPRACQVHDVVFGAEDAHAVPIPVGEKCSVCEVKPRNEEREIFDPSDTIYPDHYFPVPDRIIGNILDHWELIPGDAKQELKDELSGFYTAMQRLTDWIEENR